MIILGDNIVPHIDTFFIDNIFNIKNTKANSVVIFDYDVELLKYSCKHNIDFAVIVNSLKEALYANALNASYIICKQDLDEKLQETAENYMFDAKILSIIENSDEIETIASKKIDGVIYKNLLKSEA